MNRNLWVGLLDVAVAVALVVLAATAESTLAAVVVAAWGALTLVLGALNLYVGLGVRGRRS